MKRTTIFMDEVLLKEMKEISEYENISVAGMVREAMAEYVVKKRRPEKKLSFTGIGDSGRNDISEKHEDLLWKEPEE